MPKRQRPEHIGKLIGKDHDPWFGIELIDHEELRISLRDTFCRLILSLPQDCRVGGFKEIRYHHHQKYFANYMDALRRTFPDTRIIFQTREWTQVAKSAWWKKWDPARVEDIVTTSDANFMKYQNAYPEHCFTVTYEKLVGGTDNARTLIEFLGEELPESAISSILQEKLTH